METDVTHSRMRENEVGARDAYVKAALVGVGLYLVGALIIAIAVLISEPSEVVFLLFLLIPAAVVASALLFVRRWGLIVGILGGLLGLLGFMEDIDLILTTPKAFFDFAAGVFIIPGLLILLIASILGTVQYFRGAVSRDLSPTAATLLRGAVGALVLVAVVSAVVTAMNAGDASAEERQGAMILTAEDTEWDLDRMEGLSDQPLKLVVRNEDGFLHTFTIYDLDIDVRLGPFSEEVVEINAPAGTYGYVCRIFDHESDMTGALEIR